MIVYQQNFEWDLREAATNLATYGVTFKEAATVFAAEDLAITEDAETEQLYARGSSARGRVLVVLHTRGVRVRIIGAMVQQGAAAGGVEGVTEPGAEVVTEVEVTEVEVTEVEVTEVEVTEVENASEAEVVRTEGTIDTVSTENAVTEVIEAAAGVADLEAAVVEAAVVEAAVVEAAVVEAAVVEAAVVEAAVVEAPSPRDIEEARATEPVTQESGEPQVPRNDSAPLVPDATDLAKTSENDVVKTVTEVVAANEIPAAEAAPRPRRRIIPFRPRSESTSAQVPASADVTNAKTANDFVDVTKTSKTNAVMKAVAEPAPRTEATTTPKPPTEPHRRPGRPRAEAAKSTTQLVLDLTGIEKNEPTTTTPEAPAGSRRPGAGMTAEEYGIYWDAYSAARDEAKLQGKSLHVAQRLGREAGDRAVLGGAPAPKTAGPAPKPAAKAQEPAGSAANAQEPAAPAPKPAAKAPKPAAKAPTPTAKAPTPASVKAPKKKVRSWRAAARAVK